jgi:hypothetical protein
VAGSDIIDNEADARYAPVVDDGLEDARARSIDIRPRCPFVAAGIRRHTAYLSVVPSRYRGCHQSS